MFILCPNLTPNIFFQNLQDEVESLVPQLDFIKDTTASLIMDAPEGANTQHVSEASEELCQRHEKLRRDIDDILNHLEQGSEAVHDIQVGGRRWKPGGHCRDYRPGTLPFISSH